MDNSDKPNEWQTDVLSSNSTEVKQKPSPKKWSFHVGFLGLLALGLCLCAGFTGLSIAAGAFSTANESTNEWLTLSDAYMQAMSTRDVDTAYGLFADEVRREFSRRELELMIEGPLFAAYVDYEKLEIDSWEVNYEFPAGKYVSLSGPVSYHGSYEGYFEAVMKEEAESWEIIWFFVNAPTEKFNDYENSVPRFSIAPRVRN